MKKCAFLLLLLLYLPLLARADAARDVTAQAAIEINGMETRAITIRDGDEETGVAAPGDVEQIVWITPGEDAVAAAYIEFGKYPSSVSMDSFDGEKWRREVMIKNPGYAELTLEFPPQKGLFRLEFTPLLEGDRLYIRELRLFTEGERKADAARSWQRAPEKADILFVVAHPDDELLWFGGAIPGCVDAGKRVQVTYLTCETPTRRLELLNGLWHCGLRGYPEIWDLPDEKVSQWTINKHWKEQQALQAAVQLLRSYQPEVVVTHSLDGEYGHNQHILCAELMRQAVKLAADGNWEPQLGKPWEVKKLYLHGGETPTLGMDWDQPLSSFNGKTGIQLAREAYAYHISQQKRGHLVAAAGEEYDSTLFTLDFSLVGEDEEKNDFFEHLPAEP